MIRCGFGAGAEMAGVTPVQNIFMIEYMPKAPEGYTKVYLYGLMQCCCRSMEIEDAASALDISEDELMAALMYWQAQGLVKLTEGEPPYVEYKNIVAAPPAAGCERKYASLISALSSAAMKRKRLCFTGSELSKMYDWIEIFGMEQEAAVLLVEHCMAGKGPNISVQFMDAVAKGWADAGVLSADAARERIQRDDELKNGANAILRRWRYSRRATEDEIELYRVWTEDYGMTGADVLAACPSATASERPTFAYLDGVLRAMRQSGGVSEALRASDRIAELARQAFARAGITRPASRAQRDEIERWTSAWHMEPETILLAAEYAASASRPYADMQRNIKDWHEQGIVDVAGAKRAHDAPSRPAQKGGKPTYFTSYSQRRYTDDELKHIGVQLDEED